MGATGAAAIADPAGATVIVDVLSWSSSVTVAVERGTAVYPYPWRAQEAEAFAASHNAVCAVGRDEVDQDYLWSLSPARLLAAAHVERLVLPSPNGSAIAAAGAGGTVVAGCLRNATAVARWLSGRGFGQPGRPIAVVAAGERWPDGGLRPALEDLLGAGAILAALSGDARRSPAPMAALGGAGRSPEATSAEAAWEAHRRRLAETLAGCSSGRELIEAGYGDDVTMASEHDVATVVPVLSGGAFRPG